MKKYLHSIVVLVIANFFIVLSFIIIDSNHALQEMTLKSYMNQMGFDDIFELVMISFLLLTGLFIDFIYLILFTLGAIKKLINWD